MSPFPPSDHLALRLFTIRPLTLHEFWRLVILVESSMSNVLLRAFRSAERFIFHCSVVRLAETEALKERDLLTCSPFRLPPPLTLNTQLCHGSFVGFDSVSPFSKVTFSLACADESAA